MRAFAVVWTAALLAGVTSLAACSKGNGAAAGGATAGVSGTPAAGGAGAGAAGAGVAGSGGATGSPDGGAGQAGNAGDPIVAAFATQAQAIAQDYKSWGRVDDELRWAPFLCRIPLPGIARASASDDPATHGKKLYSVFVKNHDAYPGGSQTDQVVVKESWIPELVSESATAFSPESARFAPDAGDHFYGYAKGDGGVYRAGAFAGLYIMYRLPADTPETDQGWVYATITAAGQVTAAGRVSSCMGCHEDATHERLFGVPLSPSVP